MASCIVLAGAQLERCVRPCHPAGVFSAVALQGPVTDEDADEYRDDINFNWIFQRASIAA